MTKTRIVQSLLKENFEFKKLYEEHASFEKELETLSKKKYVDDSDEVTKKILQKKKLSGRDRMEQLIHEYEKKNTTN
ncbi:MAG: DUF465 domain-containing protein [Bdellovibrionota bacterium]